MPTQERLRELFDYRAGLLFYKVCRGRKHVGDVAGCRRTNGGYWVHSVNGAKLLLHRIIWVFHNGQIPAGMVVDHIDHDPSNNLIENLRLVTITENNRNQSKYRGNNPYTGVYPHRTKWHAEIHQGRKKVYLGTFDTPEQAHQARLHAQKHLGYHPNHGKEKTTRFGVAA